MANPTGGLPSAVSVRQQAEEPVMEGSRAASPAGVAAQPGRPRQPLSFAQEHLWFLEQVMPGTPTYTMPLVRRLRGDLRPDLLQQALTGLVARHPALRVRFGSAQGVPYQVQ